MVYVCIFHLTLTEESDLDFQFFSCLAVFFSVEKRVWLRYIRYFIELDVSKFVRFVPILIYCIYVFSLVDTA